jgi:hypothetical protein
MHGKQRLSKRHSRQHTARLGGFQAHLRSEQHDSTFIQIKAPFRFCRLPQDETARSQQFHMPYFQFAVKMKAGLPDRQPPRITEQKSRCSADIRPDRNPMPNQARLADAVGV